MSGAGPNPAALDRVSTWEEFCSASGMDPVELRQALFCGLSGSEHSVEHCAIKEAQMNAPEPILLELVGQDEFVN